MKRLLLVGLLLTGMAAFAQSPYFPGRGKPTGPPTVSSLTADELTSRTNAQNALTTAAQNLAAINATILKNHGDKPCLPTDSTCTRASFRPDGFIETVTYSQSPRPTPAARPAPKKPQASLSYGCDETGACFPIDENLAFGDLLYCYPNRIIAAH